MEALCREQTLDPHERYTLVCGRGNDRNDCVPQCTPALHGDILMLNIDGSDRKYSCELHDDKYSWMGSTAFGGYVRILSSPNSFCILNVWFSYCASRTQIGLDTIAFLASVKSGVPVSVCGDSLACLRSFCTAHTRCLRRSLT